MAKRANNFKFFYFFKDNIYQILQVLLKELLDAFILYMNKTIFLRSIVLSLSIIHLVMAWGQEQDSTSIPTVDYNRVRERVIADIRVTGSESYEDYILIGFSGLSVGQEIKIPGTEITSAVTRFWDQSYFSDVKILIDKITEDSVWLHIALKQRPKISKINFYGLKKSEVEDIEKKSGLTVGEQLTPDLIDRSKLYIKKHFAEKGFGNTTIQIYQKNDPSTPGSVIVDVTVDKRQKVKINQIYVTGNSALSVGQIDQAMKKTNRKHLFNTFKSKNFIDAKYQEDKRSIIDKYNEIGYRDARLVSDSIVILEDGRIDIYLTVEEGKKYYFGDITWSGNTVYDSKTLSHVLNINRGDVYNQNLFEKRLYADEDAVSTLYKDNGYLFFYIDPVESGIDGDSINFEMRLYEGKQATINNVTINGNDRVYEYVIRRELRTRPGALYSQSDLVRSLRDLAQMKLFNEEMLYNATDIQPHQEDGTVDITYNLEGKSSDEVEFSAGYGQESLILSIGLKFTNFAIQNLFRKDMYRFVPQGEGQTFALRVQSNGKRYQNYSISFFEPWLGGKRPNSLSVGLYYSVQTGLSNRYLENYENNIINQSIYNGYYPNQGTSFREYDESQFLRTLGASIGIGTRLHWPDDYFSLYTEFSYQRYHLKNWLYGFFGFTDGRANSLTLGLTLSRNSIDNPIYTRRGSTVSVSVRATPPFSMFNNIDYSTVSDAERMRWVEYHKWKFNAKLFTPLSKDDKLVLMTRAEYGFLGYYNSHKRSPFEKFTLGGDGMSGGYVSYGTESIGLRGYTSGSLTPMDAKGISNGNIYTRLTVELRYPVIMQQATTIWALAFLEAGNSWSDFKHFNPFDLKRSAGVGVRVFLPMFGLLGVDWGYGFDPVYGSRNSGGSQWAFVLGQEF